MSGRLAIIGLLLASCTPGPSPVKPAAPHPKFPLEGPHAVACFNCHPPTVSNYRQFSCETCHEKVKTTADHASVGGFLYASEACYSCHADGRAGSGPNVSPSVHDPAQDVKVTAQVPTFNGPFITEVTPTVESLPMRMNHQSGSIPKEALSQCKNCHRDAELGRLYPGQFHGALQSMNLIQPAKNCASCHDDAFPLGFVGPADSNRAPVTGAMRHDVDGGVGDCSSCHVSPSLASAATWATQASFHQNAGRPAACLECHANSRPGTLSAPDAGLPPGLVIDHQAAVWLGDCASCHASTSTWRGGAFHATNPNPPSCLPCHAKERPTVEDGGHTPPFDFANHAAGQDCATCHTNKTTWKGGAFTHGAETSCVGCHATQRPAAPVNGFDHVLSGTGDCFGCHVVTAHAVYPGDWSGGQVYPGNRLIASSDRFVLVNQTQLRRNDAGFVTSTTVTTNALYNAMLHTSAAIPGDAGIAPGAAGDLTTCWHCHTSQAGTTTVTQFRDGVFHASLATYRPAPLAAITGLAQPQAGCTDCHANMRPKDIVQRSSLQAMDHAAKADGGTAISLLDCSTCHKDPGGGWDAGVFHVNGPAVGQLDDCVSCHFPLMADAPKVDVISTASPTFKMAHRSAQLPFQKCDRCHANAASNAGNGATANLWNPGKFHPNLAAQPSGCLDCHADVTVPHQLTQSGNAYKGVAQGMSHQAAVVAAKDCAVCHAYDPIAKWSNKTIFHRPGVTPTTCAVCHAGNAPAGLDVTPAITSASAASGVAGTADQIAHSDLNVTGHDCGFCHQPGSYADAGFHARFTTGTGLQLNGTTGRCSNCHENVKPTPAFAPQNHSAFTATSAIDCSACHQFPGTGTNAAPNWHRSVAAPNLIGVGGFTVSAPPASNATTVQPGLTNLAHPAVPAGGSCTSCHAAASGGRNAFGYDHALAPATGCSACHEAGSNLVGTPWTSNAPGAVQLQAVCGLGGGTVADRGGDTRPVGLTSLACSASASGQTCGGANCVSNHFYPSDCGECHQKPLAGLSTVKTGAPFVSNWKFQHYFGLPAQQATCCHCHAPPSCRG